MCRLDKYALIKHPLTTESAMRKVEDTNTLVFIVDLKATKQKIKEAMNELYKIKPVKVRLCLYSLLTEQCASAAGEHADNAGRHQEGVREVAARSGGA